jgi:ribose/xylose/arabinose/galactoside ABC-type transport system permease subunit
MPVVIMVLFVLFMTVVERRSLLGKHARATGSNPEAAQLSGVPTRQVWLALFVASGAAAGWGGIMVSARTGGYSYTIGVGFEFQVIVACVLGGTSLAGGQGLVFGSMLGALIVGTLNNGMNLLLLPTFWQTVVLGVVLVLAVVLDAGLRRRADRVRAGIGRRVDPEPAAG